MNLTVWQWVLLATGAFFIGLSKTGVAGLGVLSVALFANALPARASTGALLPLLLSADLFGVGLFRKHASWPQLWRLFPWVVPGLLAGFLTMDHISNAQVQRMIGGILLVMVAAHLSRRRALEGSVPPSHPWWLAALAGLAAGFTTMVANAAGPVMTVYLLAVGLPKLVFVGTAAWFFMLVNALKVPFSVHLGLINAPSLLMDAALLLPMIPGALLGPMLLRRLDQHAFEMIVLGLTVLASLRLLF
jgi:uncharacterized membrane protein YfcA